MAIALRSSAKAHGTGTTQTVAKPAGLTVGDFLLFALGTSGSSPSDVTGPEGFTEIGSGYAGDAGESHLYYKYADAADVAASDFHAHTASTRVWEVIAAAITGLATTGVVVDSGSAANGAPATSFSLDPDVATAAATNLLIAMCHHKDNYGAPQSAVAVAANDPASWTVVEEASDFMAGVLWFGVASGAGDVGAWSATLTTSTRTCIMACALAEGEEAPPGGTTPLHLCRTHFINKGVML
jgi:hypothetical protein